MLDAIMKLAELVQRGFIELKGNDRMDVLLELSQLREQLAARDKGLEEVLARIDKIIAEWKAANNARRDL